MVTDRLDMDHFEFADHLEASALCLKSKAEMAVSAGKSQKFGAENRLHRKGALVSRAPLVVLCISYCSSLLQTACVGLHAGEQTLPLLNQAGRGRVGNRRSFKLRCLE